MALQIFRSCCENEVVAKSAWYLVRVIVSFWWTPSVRTIMLHAPGDASICAPHMPPMLCCVSASVQSLMLFPCHHVSACGAFDASCGGVHHVEHLLFLCGVTPFVL